MRYRIVKKGGKYVRKFSLDTEDWVSLMIMLAVLGIAIIQIISWG